MGWIFAALIVLVLGGVGLVAAGSGAPLGEEYGDQPDAFVPSDRMIGAEDLGRVRFSTAFRGYRMDEVDALISRLREEAEWRDASLAGAVKSAESEVGTVDTRPRPAKPDSGSLDV